MYPPPQVWNFNLRWARSVRSMSAFYNLPLPPVQHLMLCLKRNLVNFNFRWIFENLNFDFHITMTLEFFYGIHVQSNLPKIGRRCTPPPRYSKFNWASMQLINWFVATVANSYFGFFKVVKSYCGFFKVLKSFTAFTGLQHLEKAKIGLHYILKDFK